MRRTSPPPHVAGGGKPLHMGPWWWGRVVECSGATEAAWCPRCHGTALVCVVV